MCGIAGFLEGRGASGLSGRSPAARLGAMLETIEHRGPDDWGTAYFGYPARAAASPREAFLNGSTRVALGHRRLSILDLSEAGRQPMASADGEAWVVFNGEIYNYLELRCELEREGMRFATGTDTEVLLAAWQRWGAETLGRLDGMFAFALLDRRRNELVCARDPLGIKPFYWARHDGAFLFGSEPRAVLAGLGGKPHLDAARVAEFLVLGLSDHDDGTFYREVSQLPGGCFMTVAADGRVSEPRRYWSPPTDTYDAPDVPERLHEALALSVSRQLRSDVPVGSALSGGLDSGAIAVTVGELMGEQASRYTAITLTSPRFADDESALARLTSEQAGIRWVGVEPSLGVLADELERMVAAMGEPFSSLSMFAGWKVMERARAEGLKVMLDGQGGDELYVGYGRVVQRILPHHLAAGRLGAAAHEWLALSRNASLPLVTTALGNLFFRSGSIALSRNRRRLEGMVDRGLLAEVRPDVAAELYASADMRKVQRDELTRFCLPRLLRYEDRNSMAFSVEARVPHLGMPLLDFALRLPPHWQVRDGWTKVALRDAMRGRLSPAVLDNTVKRGFDVPQRRWVEAARDRIAARLGELPLSSPVAPASVLARIDAGMGDSLWLWKVISVALWMRRFEVAS